MSQSPTASAEFMDARMVSLPSNIELCVETGGNPENPAILLVMGLGVQLTYWPDTLVKKLIDAGFYVVRFDNRDIGYSTKIRKKGASRINRLKLIARAAIGLRTEDPRLPYHLEDMAQDVAELIEALDLKSVHLIGGSMGGMIAQIVAGTRPELVKTLGLLFTSNNTAFSIPPFPKQLKTLFTAPKSLDREDLIAHSINFQRIIGTPGTPESTHRELAAKSIDRSFHPAGFVHQFLAITASGSLVKYDKKIKAPTVVLHGTVDRLVHTNSGKAVAKKIKGAKFVALPGMGHDILPSYEDKITTEFLSHIKAHAA